MTIFPAWLHTGWFLNYRYGPSQRQWQRNCHDLVSSHSLFYCHLLSSCSHFLSYCLVSSSTSCFPSYVIMCDSCVSFASNHWGPGVFCASWPGHCFELVKILVVLTSCYLLDIHVCSHLFFSCCFLQIWIFVQVCCLFFSSPTLNFL